MFVVTGIKRTTRRLGWVADLCPNCREVRPFHLFSLRLMEHVYWIPLRHLGTTGHRVQCDMCGFVRDAEISRYVSIQPTQASDLPTLTKETNPMLAEAIAMNLSADELEATLREPDPDPASGVIKILLERYRESVKRHTSVRLNAVSMLGVLFSGVTITVALFSLMIGAWIAFGVASVLSIVGLSIVAAGFRAKSDRFRSRTQRRLLIGEIMDIPAAGSAFREAAARCAVMDIPIARSLGRGRIDEIADRLDQLASKTSAD